MASIIMLGTSSDAGKSVLTAGICRYLLNKGYSVAPFKAMNMSNNSQVCEGGFEISSATAMQARACSIEPCTDMNPILLKPFLDSQNSYISEVIVDGLHHSYLKSSEFGKIKLNFFNNVNRAYQRMVDRYDIVIVEGAGAASEINLRSIDIANFGLAQKHNIPAVLVADIERGGVIAAIVGTCNVIGKQDLKLLRGYIINKFRGNKQLFVPAARFIKQNTNLIELGILPYDKTFDNLPKEDTMSFANINNSKYLLLDDPNLNQSNKKIHVVILRLRSISNFDEFRLLENNDDLDCVYLEPNLPLPSNTDLLIIPGSKSIVSDLIVLEDSGMVHDILSYYRRGGKIFAVCGGYAMLGVSIQDKNKIESNKLSHPGLNLIDYSFQINNNKIVEKNKATLVAKLGGSSFCEVLSCYEIHRAEVSFGFNQKRALLKTSLGVYEGYVSDNKQIIATFMHGLTENPCFISSLMQTKINQTSSLDQNYDKIADLISENLNMDGFERIVFDK